ncbi:hypothetical protein ANN_01572 [Periplaneta americana]|uniref:MADF domain-containing protein n=1 Tax=Periplaneta americana TaxID=6978 RepID=A0ABQ8TY13_PERAM|nr:hypothetical protein ANN_01572 [Periplaneta americana]
MPSELLFFVRKARICSIAGAVEVALELREERAVDKRSLSDIIAGKTATLCSEPEQRGDKSDENSFTRILGSGSYSRSGRSIEMDMNSFIGAVFSRPILWDQRNKNHHNRFVLDKLWDEVAQEFGVTSKILSLNLCII